MILITNSDLTRRISAAFRKDDNCVSIKFRITNHTFDYQFLLHVGKEGSQRDATITFH